MLVFSFVLLQKRGTPHTRAHISPHGHSGGCHAVATANPQTPFEVRGIFLEQISSFYGANITWLQVSTIISWPTPTIAALVWHIFLGSTKKSALRRPQHISYMGLCSGGGGGNFGSQQGVPEVVRLRILTCKRSRVCRLAARWCGKGPLHPNFRGSFDNPFDLPTF